MKKFRGRKVQVGKKREPYMQYNPNWKAVLADLQERFGEGDFNIEPLETDISLDIKFNNFNVLREYNRKF